MTSIQFDEYSARAAEQAANAVVHSRGDKLRRALNVAVAVLGLTVAAPLLLLIAAAIKLTSCGPVIYQQTRVGLDRRRSVFSSGRRRGFDRRLGVDRRRLGYDGTGGRRKGSDRRDATLSRVAGRRSGDAGGRPFTIYKFRTMTATNGDSDSQVWASPDDPRVTPIGRLLRKYRLDELPQLVNVVLGDMNIVGPRPEQPRIFSELRGKIDDYEERQRVLPGITGWAQINHHYDVSIDSVRQKTSYDLEYVAKRSPAKDVEIMLRTVPVMVFKKGAW